MGPTAAAAAAWLGHQQQQHATAAAAAGARNIVGALGSCKTCSLKDTLRCSCSSIQGEDEQGPQWRLYQQQWLWVGEGSSCAACKGTVVVAAAAAAPVAQHVSAAAVACSAHALAAFVYCRMHHS